MGLDGYGLKSAAMHRYAPVRIIGPENSKEEVISEPRPVLLLCMPLRITLYEQIGVMKRISKDKGGALKVCLFDEDYIRAFKEEFAVAGTPTYLLFVNGREKGRMLGHREANNGCKTDQYPACRG